MLRAQDSAAHNTEFDLNSPSIIATSSFSEQNISRVSSRAIASSWNYSTYVFLLSGINALDSSMQAALREVGKQRSSSTIVVIAIHQVAVAASHRIGRMQLRFIPNL